MKRFRTFIDITPASEKISYQSRCLFMGSCFSDEIGIRMLNLKFPVLSNPFGTLFNPLSISANLLTLIGEKHFTESDLDFHDGMWFSFSHYTGFARLNRKECLDNINRGLTEASAWLQLCDYLLITFGTAWTFTHVKTGRRVANCHKLPAGDFTRELLNVADITENYSELIDQLRKVNPGIRIIFSVSPVRHWKDGAVNNQVSKSILLLSIRELVKNHHNILYFPAYEIFMDELRDYRFYAADMLHPSDQGIDYVWERFCDTCFAEDTKKIMAGVSAILKAAEHRPRQTDSHNLLQFAETTLKQIDQLTLTNPLLDFSHEIALMQGYRHKAGYSP